MNLKMIFTVYGVYNILLGLAFVLIPGPAMEGAGITPTPDLIVTQQIWGVALIGIGWIAWALRGAEGNESLVSVAKTFIVFAALSIAVTVYHFMLGFSGPPIYINVLINLFALIGLFMKAK